MASRLLFNHKVLENVISLKTVVSSSIDVSEYVSVTTQIFWAGNPNGSIITEASNDDINYSLLEEKPTNKAPGSYINNYLYPAFRYIRIKYVPTDNNTGTITLTAYISGKET